MTKDNDLYLLNASEEQLENLRTFLRSDVKTNQLLALNMMQSGGLPEKLVEDVLRLYLDRRTGYTKKYSEEKFIVGVKSEVEKLFKLFDFEELVFPERLQHIFKDGHAAFQKLENLGIDPNGFITNFSLDFVLKSGEFEESAMAKKLHQALWSFDTELNLKRMELPALPEVIGDFTKLKRVNMTKNHLTHLPDTFGNLKKLEELVLTKNKFSEYPKGLFELESLMFLDLSENRLTVFSTHFPKLKNLKWLFLTRNFIQELPEEITGMVALENLNLGYNSLSELPGFIGDLHNLEFLNLRGNNIDKVPDEFHYLIKLKTIDLRDNPIGKNMGEKLKLKKLLPRYCELLI